MIEINFTIVLQAINFLVLVFILKRIFWEPMMRHLDNRDAMLAGRKEQTDKLRREVQEMRLDYTQRVRAARKEGMRLRDELITEGRVERIRLIREAMDEGEQLLSEGDARLRKEKAETLSSFRDDEVSQLADVIVGHVMSGTEGAGQNAAG
ncbi:MAG: ATP synthase F0 subunit B [Candidatus Coatesbacteria bacterium]|nr:ATP synthase F0 subunit B [Candidatus Coatesbacteria bacterium]